MLFEQVAQFADGAVLVVRQHFDDERRAARTVALVGDLLRRSRQALRRCRAESPS